MELRNKNKFLKTKEDVFLRSRSMFFVLTIAILSSIALIHNSRPNSNQRIKDFSVIAGALENYKKDNKEYPKAETGLWFLGGRPNKQNSNWIPGLSPKYLSKLPIDPYSSKLPNHQYIYFSNGVDYKLIAHGPEDAAAIRRDFPEMIDPIRPAYAYGIWTIGGKQW